MNILFISDLHLDANKPQPIELAIDLLQWCADKYDALYILGDLVEFWIGDDYCPPQLLSFFDSLGALANKIDVTFLPGNRDFLISEQFMQHYGVHYIKQDSRIIDVLGVPTMIMHGDTLCTDDIAYQQFRTLVRSEKWQAEFLNKTIEERLAIANHARSISRKETAKKSIEIININQITLEDVLQKNNIQQIIHGHTHRPGKHTFKLQQHAGTRWVMSDWHTEATLISALNNRCQLINWPDVRN